MELLCTIVTLLLLECTSLEFMDTGNRKYVGSNLQWKEANRPKILSIQKDELSTELHKVRSQSRHKRSEESKFLVGIIEVYLLPHNISLKKLFIL